MEDCRRCTLVAQCSTTVHWRQKECTSEAWSCIPTVPFFWRTVARGLRHNRTSPCFFGSILRHIIIFLRENFEWGFLGFFLVSFRDKKTMNLWRQFMYWRSRHFYNPSLSLLSLSSLFLFLGFYFYSWCFYWMLRSLSSIWLEAKFLVLDWE